MRASNWHEWFVPPRSDDDPPTHVIEDDVRGVSGSGHREACKSPRLRHKLPPRCASCKRFIGYDTGLHLMISSEWRIHISCFSEVLERHYEDGEVIDLTDGRIRKIEYEDS